MIGLTDSLVLLFRIQPQLSFQSSNKSVLHLVTSTTFQFCSSLLTLPYYALLIVSLDTQNKGQLDASESQFSSNHEQDRLSFPRSRTLLLSKPTVNPGNTRNITLSCMKRNTEPGAELLNLSLAISSSLLQVVARAIHFQELLDVNHVPAFDAKLFYSEIVSTQKFHDTASSIVQSKCSND